MLRRRREGGGGGWGGGGGGGGGGGRPPGIRRAPIGRRAGIESRAGRRGAPARQPLLCWISPPAPAPPGGKILSGGGGRHQNIPYHIETTSIIYKYIYMES